MSKEANYYISDSLNHRHSGRIGEIYDGLCANRYLILKPTIDAWVSMLKTQSVAPEYNLNWPKVNTYTSSLDTSDSAGSNDYNNVVNARQAVDQAVVPPEMSTERQAQHGATINV